MKKVIESLEVKIISDIKKAIFDYAFNNVKNGNERLALKKWVNSRVDAFMNRLDVIVDAELQLQLMWFYIQLKAEWSQLNTHQQYAQMYGYRTNAKINHQKGILSAVICAIEKHINLIHVDGITTFLSMSMKDFDNSEEVV